MEEITRQMFVEHVTDMQVYKRYSIDQRHLYKPLYTLLTFIELYIKYYRCLQRTQAFITIYIYISRSKEFIEGIIGIASIYMTLQMFTEMYSRHYRSLRHYRHDMRYNCFCIIDVTVVYTIHNNQRLFQKTDIRRSLQKIDCILYTSEKCID